MHSLPAEWDEGWTLSDRFLRLTPEEAHRLRLELRDLIGRFRRNTPEGDPDASDSARSVLVQLQILPRARNLAVMTTLTGGGLLKHRDFRRLWAGETVSELGTQVSVLAVPLVAVRSLHASTFQFALLTATSTLGFLVAGLPAGAWADRIRRRRVMIAADLGRLLALDPYPIAYAFGVLGLLQLYLATLAAGLLTVFFDVAYQSYLPSLVGPDHVVEGNAKLGGSADVAQLAGPSLAGGLVQLIGGSYAIAVDAASFFFSAVYVKSIRKKEEVPPAHERGFANLGREIFEGLRFVVNHR